MRIFLAVLTLTLWGAILSSQAQAATALERYQSLLTALNDEAPSVTLQNKVADAIVELERDWLVANGYDPGTLTNAQQATLVLRVVKRALKAVVLKYDPNVSTAESDLEAAVSTAQASVEADLPDEGNP